MTSQNEAKTRVDRLPRWTPLPQNLLSHTADPIGRYDPYFDNTSAPLPFVGDHGAVIDVITDYGAVGVTPDFQKPGTYIGDTGSMDAVTDRQQEVIEAAHEIGCEDVFRDIAPADVAATLGLDAATVGEPLK